MKNITAVSSDYVEQFALKIDALLRLQLIRNVHIVEPQMFHRELQTFDAAFSD
jgi:hypothetical protein